MEITQELVTQCNSFSELTRHLGKSPHSRITHQLRKKLINLKLSFSHFTSNGVIPKPKIEKICPICKSIFVPKYRKKQVTCSYSCANIYFARKRHQGNYKHYTSICWSYHEKKCIVCGEDKIVAVHHMDENHENNDPKNLVPLCPTHHNYWHSKYRELIRQKVEDFLKIPIIIKI